MKRILKIIGYLIVCCSSFEFGYRFGQSNILGLFEGYEDIVGEPVSANEYVEGIKKRSKDHPITSRFLGNVSDFIRNQYLQDFLD